MKALQVITLCVLSLTGLIGCVSSSTLRKIPAITAVSKLDFTTYAERGFLFTPYLYTDAYDGLGMIKVVMSAEATRDLERNRQDQIIIGDWKITPISVQDALEEIYQQAIALGSDAVVSLEVKYEPKIVQSLNLGLPTWEVSGFAIKRK